jgi:hypothetical protein
MRLLENALWFLFAPCVWAVSVSALAASAEPFNPSTFQPFNSHSYTNHAGNAVSGTIIALDARTATFSNAEEVVVLPLSIFPPSEQRRLAADYGTPILPAPIRRAIAGAQKAITRSRQRAAQGLCTPEESSTFITHTQSALTSYLDTQLASGAITPAEHQSILSTLP